MRLLIPTLLSLAAIGCTTAPTPLTRPDIRGMSGCTFVVPPDVRPRARFQTRVTLDMNEWCEKIAATDRRASDAI